MRRKTENGRKLAQAHTSIEAALSEQIDRIARERRWSRANVVYVAITEYLAREKKRRVA